MFFLEHTILCMFFTLGDNICTSLLSPPWPDVVEPSPPPPIPPSFWPAYLSKYCLQPPPSERFLQFLSLWMVPGSVGIRDQVPASYRWQCLLPIVFLGHCSPEIAAAVSVCRPTKVTYQVNELSPSSTVAILAVAWVGRLPSS